MRKYFIWSALLALLALMSVPAGAQATLVVDGAGSAACTTSTFTTVDEAIACAGANDTISIQTSPVAGFTVDISDITIEGNGNTVNSTITLGVAGSTVNNITLRDIVSDVDGFMNTSSSNITIPPTATINGLVIEGSTFRDAARNIVQTESCDATPGTPRISNVAIHNNLFTAFRFKGIYLTQASDMILSENTFDGSSLQVDPAVDTPELPRALELDMTCAETYENVYILKSTFINGPVPTDGSSSVDRSSAIQLNAQGGTTFRDITIDGVNITGYHQGIALFANKFGQLEGTMSFNNPGQADVLISRSRITTHSQYRANDEGKELWGLINASDASISADFNWWGTNEGPNNPDFTTGTPDTNPDDNNTTNFGDNIGDPRNFSGDENTNINNFGDGATEFIPWLVLELTADSPIQPGDTSTITGEFVPSAGSAFVTSAIYNAVNTGISVAPSVTVPPFPDDVEIDLAEQTAFGTLSSGSAITSGGTFTVDFTADTGISPLPQTAIVEAELDNQVNLIDPGNEIPGPGAVPVDILIEAPPPTEEPTPEPTQPPSDVGDDGGAADTGTDDAPGLADVTVLPTTGESPAWRDPLLLLLAALVTLGGYVGVRRMRQ